jgi:hypothetical protein
MLTNTSVIYIDPFVDQKLTCNGKEFGVPKDRNTQIASRVSYNDITIHSFKTNASIAEAELKTLVEIKMYEEAGLDLQKQYTMHYIKKELEFSDTVLVEAFAIEQTKTKATLQTVLKSEKYIDFLALPFLAFSTLYHTKILALKNDLFVYISNTEAFLALYKEGRYISTKSIFNLEEMVKKLKKEEIELSIESLQKLLAEKGLDAASYGEEDFFVFTALQNLFSEIFTKINDILMHNRNVFNFDSIDRIFMDTAAKRIKGLRTFLSAFGYTDIELNDFKLLKNCASEHPFNCIVALYAYDQLSTQSNADNVTFLVRPPQFFKTEVGKFSVWVAASVLLGVLYPLYLSLSTLQLEEERAVLQAQNEAIKKSSSLFTQELLKITTDIKSVSETKEEQIKAFRNITQSVDELYLMKLSSQTYVDFIVKVNAILKKYQLMVRSIEQKGSNQMVIEVVASEAQRDGIAKFMEALIEEGFLGVNTEEIRSEKSLYISKIEIAR